MSNTVNHPLRIQRSRKAGSRLPEGAICVSRPGRWGNPFETALSFRLWLAGNDWLEERLVKPIDRAEVAERRDWILENIDSLKGRQLACWCNLQTFCHADVLAELANA